MMHLSSQCVGYHLHVIMELVSTDKALTAGMFHKLHVAIIMIKVELIHYCFLLAQIQPEM